MAAQQHKQPTEIPESGMSQVNYNHSFGGRKAAAPSETRSGRIFFLIFLLLLIAAVGGWLLWPKFFGHAVAPKTASTSLEVPIPTQPVPPVPVRKLKEPAAVVTPSEPAVVSGTHAAAPASAPSRPVPVPAPVAAAEAVPASVSADHPSKAGTRPEYRQCYQQAETAWRDGEYAAAREAADKAMTFCPNNSPEWLAAARLLGQANLKIITTDCPLPGKKEKHRIVAGDSLQKLAKEYNTTVEIIQRSNHMRPDDNNVMLDKVFKIYKGAWHIAVSKKDFRLYLYDGDKLFKYYGIGIGKQGRTPRGNFHIVAKVVEPDWYSPHGKVPYRDQDNPIGTRWMQLKPDEGVDQDLSGYGIHGTWDRTSIGKSRSNGCIRMLNEDVEELFDLVPYQTPVTIAE